MPLSSRAQYQKLMSLEKEGKVKEGTADEFLASTPGGYFSLPDFAPKRKGAHHKKKGGKSRAKKALDATR